MHLGLPSVSRFEIKARAPNGASAPPDPRRVHLPVFFWALLSWERGSSRGKAVQTLEETVQVIYFSLQTVCFSSVEKFHLQKDQNSQAASAVYSAHRAGILSVGLKWWNSEFPFGFVMLWTRWFCQQPTPARSQLGEGACLAALCLQSHPEPPSVPVPWARQWWHRPGLLSTLHGVFADGVPSTGEDLGDKSAVEAV